MKNLFILELTYQKDLSQVEKFLELHNQYLQKNYDLDHFICSGRKNPRTGGIILARLSSKEDAESIIKEDPFLIHGIATYSIIEFVPTKFNNEFTFNSLFESD
ncbi:GTP cyclohydrolase [Enterococcus sp. ALS3]|uniref:GTP cyclohydrolase n=1 Tax=Enterococcus alishanensis TaxID=1303817 RepID=A0ABS6TH76_9ENTE|nr:YciI family protein [Enterococcus alishanensis]EAE5656507.1 GTP cyclohydrolase [Listeria monocytogenes]EAE5696876.1 GTP cyclohydrolase [Listeria monocytogenes]MBV7392232.1 GTP cyclohydrolase [Enterococcus alishanensis]